MPILSTLLLFVIFKDKVNSKTITGYQGNIEEKLNFDPCLPAEAKAQVGLGRMLSPDPILQAPANSQNYNRYTYAMNNPLKFIDPSGYTSDKPERDTRESKEEGILFYMGSRGEVYTKFNNNGSENAIQTSIELVARINEDGSISISQEIITRDGRGNIVNNTPTEDEEKEDEEEKKNLPSTNEYKNGEIISVDGKDYFLHDNKWLLIKSQAEYDKYVENYSNPKGGVPWRRGASEIFRYNQKIVQLGGIKGAVIGGSGGFISKILTRFKIWFTPIGIISGYLGGQLDAWNEMEKRIDQHDRMVDYYRNKQ